jgi:glycerol-3-phosphate acyltransferase PlsY
MLLITILGYFWGCCSTARMIAKTFRSLNIYRVGTGLADTENIYVNVSKPMGILVGLLDVTKALLFLIAAQRLLVILDHRMLFEGVSLLYSRNIMVVYGLGIILGHTLPVTHRFRGGRGIFTYTGVVAFFAFYPMLITILLAWAIVAFFRQIRFAQYLIVILPVILTQVFYTFIPHFRNTQQPYFFTFLLGLALVMGVLNFIVSKKLGEL